MRYVSTRGQARPVGLSEALMVGLAPDGGLYVPSELPSALRALASPSAARRHASGALPDVAKTVLTPFFADDSLANALPAICDEAFDFPAPLEPLRNEGDYVLELFHGPTAAFKDYAARFLTACLVRLRRNEIEPLTILVATSGDTGAAVAAACDHRPGLRVVILYPEGRVSPRQAHGLECWGGNVRAFRVVGSFDDCQRLAKQALAEPELRARLALGTANSISLGRWLPQMAYYVQAALRFSGTHAAPLNFIIPTGNLGNATACVLARALGLPIGDIVLACNDNRVLPDFFAGAAYAPRPSLVTLATAMDIGAPSNLERLRWLFPDDATLRVGMRALAVDDATIRATIQTAPERHGIVPCPHTACALHALARLRAVGDTRPWAAVATAHPAKFETVVEPLIGRRVPPPPVLAECLSRPARGERLAADYAALRTALLG